MTEKRLLEDGSSFRVLEDGTSKRLLETPDTTTPSTIPIGRVVLEVAFTNDPLDATVTYVDITGDMRDDQPAWIRRGRSTRLDSFNAGQHGLMLRNADRKYDPDNASSVYNGMLKVNKRNRLSLEYPWLPGKLTNAGFELGATTGWAASGSATLAISTTTPYLGSFCGLVTATGSGGGGARSQATLIAAGQNLSGSARVLTSLASRNAAVTIEWFTDTAGTVANTSTSGTTTPLTASVYTRVPFGPFVAPAGTQSFRVTVGMAGAGWVNTDTMRVDAVVADEATTQTVVPVSTGFVDVWGQDGDGVRDAWCTMTATDGFKIFAKDRINASGYQAAVLASAPTNYLPLTEPSGSSNFADLGSSPHTGVAKGEVTAGLAGLVAMDSGTSVGIALNNGIDWPGAEFTAYPFVIDLWLEWAADLVPDPLALDWTYIPFLTQKHGGDPASAGVMQFSLGYYAPSDALYVWSSGENFGRYITGTLGPSVDLLDGNPHYISMSFGSPGIFTNIDGGAYTYATAMPYSVPPTGGVLSIGQGIDGYFTEWFGTMQHVALYKGVTARPLHYIAGSGWGSELSGARINRILNIIRWPAADRNIDVGAQTIIPGGLNDVNTRALSYMQQVETAEGAQLFMAGNGSARFINRRAYGKAPYNTVQAIFGTGTGELAYDQLQPNGPYRDDQLIVNHSEFERREGVAQPWEDATSIGDYGFIDRSTSDVLVPADTDALALAQLDVYTNKTPMPRVDALSFTLRSDAQWKERAVREIGDLVELRWRPPGITGGTYVSYIMRIEGINDTIGRNSWKVTYQLSNFGVQPGWLVLNDSVLGKLNTGILAA